jgi:hypothetical protein
LLASLAKDKNLTLDKLAKKFANVDFRPAAAMWQRSGLVALGKTTPSARNQEVRAAMNELVAELMK